MILEQEIKDWWECKIETYLQNYAWRNILTTAQAKERFFTETHEKFIELVPQLLKKILHEKSRSTSGPRATRETDLRGKNKPVGVVWKDHRRILRGASHRRKNFSRNHLEEILSRPYWVVPVLLTDLLVQVPDRKRSGSYCRTFSITTRTATKFQLGGETKEVGEIHCRKRVGVFPKKLNRIIQAF